MIVKKPEKNSLLLKTEALLNRLNPNHERFSEISENLRKLLAGYNGERTIFYYLSFLPEKQYYIFHNLRLPNGNYHFQIDYLVLTSSFACILECKNFFGTLFFDDSFKQLIRLTDEREEGFLDPISQAKWHQQQLRNWLTPLQLPVEYYVVISNPSTILKTNPQNKQALNKVIHSHSLLEKLEILSKRYSQNVVDNKELRKLSKRLLKQHFEEPVDILAKYNIFNKQIITGVKCANCGTFGMSYKSGTWTCAKCLAESKHSHIEALRDYALLYQPCITNGEFRRFLRVNCPDAANYLLKSLKLEYFGKTKGRIYQLDSLLKK